MKRRVASSERPEVFKSSFEAGVKDFDKLKDVLEDLSKIVPVKVHTTNESEAPLMAESLGLGSDGWKLKFQDPDGIYIDDFEWIEGPDKYFKWYKDFMKRNPVLPKVVIDWAEPLAPSDELFNIENKHIVGKRRKEATDGVFKIWVWNPANEGYEVRETGKSKTLTHLLGEVIKPRYLDGTFERYHEEASA